MKKIKSIFLIAGILGFLLVLWFVIRQNSTLSLEKNKSGSNPLFKTPTQLVKASDQVIVLKGLKEGIEAHRQEREKQEEGERLEQENAKHEQLRLENWKANFPYHKTYHPSLTYDQNRYDPNNPTTFRGDPEMEMAVKNHGYLTAFYNNPQIYSAEFEKLFHLLEEIDRAENPLITGEIFIHLRRYHKACRFPPSKFQQQHVSETNAGNSKTWGEIAEEYKAAIVGLLVMPKYWPDKELLDADVARAFRDRLIEEIPPHNLVMMREVVELPDGEIGAFGYYGPAEKALKPGDKLIYR